MQQGAGELEPEEDWGCKLHLGETGDGKKSKVTFSNFRKERKFKEGKSNSVRVRDAWW